MFKTKIKNLLLFLWQLPQALLGNILYFLITIIVPPFDKNEYTYKETRVIYLMGINSGLALYNIIILPLWLEGIVIGINQKENDNIFIRHEYYNHILQSRKWGLLFIPIVALASLLRAFWFRCVLHTKKGYYDKWPENAIDMNEIE